MLLTAPALCEGDNNDDDDDGCDDDNNDDDGDNGLNIQLEYLFFPETH